MAADAILRSYGDSAVREDVVLNAVEILTAEENKFLSMLPKTSAINTVHSYLVDTLRTAASLAVEEAADFTASANSTPTRLTNIVEKIALNFKVSNTQRSINHYHGQDELSRQTDKALRDWGNAAEFDLVRATLTSGASGTAAKMNGIIAAISKSTNTTVHTSGTVWSASILDGLMKLNWDNSNGDVATDLFMGSITRKNTDYFTQKSNVVVNSPGATNILRTVTTYETAFGTLRLHTHRYVDIQGTDATCRVLAVNPQKLAIAYLRKPEILALAKSGDYENKAIVGDLTLEVRNQDSNWFASGFLRS